MGIRFEPSGDTVVVRLTAFDALFAIKGRLDVPLAHITSVDVMERSSVPPTPGTWLRAPGTYVPGLIRYGSYGRAPNREFWAVLRQSRVLVIGVRDWAYSRLVLGVSDPDIVAASLGWSPRR